VYDGQSGQLITGSMMDYALPKADMLPMYADRPDRHPHAGSIPWASGSRETGTIASPPAVVNAVVDALAPLGVDHIEAMPLTAERVWTIIQGAKGAANRGARCRPSWAGAPPAEARR